MKIVGDDDLVTESIQSLFVYLYEKRQSCSEPQSVSAYLCVALKRMLLNELKKTANGVFTSLFQKFFPILHILTSIKNP